jgi:His-Xaa-Ser system protein HxsD
VNMLSDPIRTEGPDRLAQIDLSVYSLEAVLKSAYRFTGRCYVHLQHGNINTVEVRMRPKRKEDDPDLAVRNFLNDLLDQRMRGLIAAETAGERILIMAHALSRANLVRPDLESAEPTTDPQHVSTPDRKRVAAS